LAKMLTATVEEVEELLVALILDSRLKGSIDQENSTLLLRQDTTDKSQYESLDKWATKIDTFMHSSYAILS
ncbi:hypothetical protein IWW50_004138, partial [Coemansia erecta]